MKQALSICLTALLISCFALFASTDADAQQSKSKTIRVRKVESNKLLTPHYDVKGNAPIGKKKTWMEISTEYDTAPKWVDELNFTYYVLVEGKEDGRVKRTLFSGKVDYINIAKGRNHKSAMYIHPSTIDRFGDIKAIAVLIRNQGKLEALVSDPETNQRWWESMSPQQGYLLGRMETPFAMLNFDDYEAVKGSEQR